MASEQMNQCERKIAEKREEINAVEDVIDELCDCPGADCEGTIRHPGYAAHPRHARSPACRSDEGIQGGEAVSQLFSRLMGVLCLLAAFMLNFGVFTTAQGIMAMLYIAACYFAYRAGKGTL